MLEGRFHKREPKAGKPRGMVGSIEYAVDHLEAKLVVVMGHRRCGAVQAGFCPRSGPHPDVLWDLIRPAIVHSLASCEHHETVDPAQWDLAVKTNVSNMAAMVAKDFRGRAGVSVCRRPITIFTTAPWTFRSNEPN